MIQNYPERGYCNPDSGHRKSPTDLDRSTGCGIIKTEKALRQAVSPLCEQFLFENRHLPGWRFLLFTTRLSVMVLPPTWNVNVKRIVSPPLGSVTNRLPMAGSGLELILLAVLRLGAAFFAFPGGQVSSIRG